MCFLAWHLFCRQRRNTELKAETSLNVDVGFKSRRKNVHLEATYFNNVVRDGIRLKYIGEEKVSEDPDIYVSLYQNTNELYSEFSTASFFRPAAKRHIVFTWSTRF